jgi:hypothetical protein
VNDNAAFAQAWEDEEDSPEDINGEVQQSEYEEEEEQEDAGDLFAGDDADNAPAEDQNPPGGQSLGAFFEEDDEEEGGAVTECGHAAGTQELLELYELAGYQIPRLAGPDCFGPNDMTYGQGLIIPTTAEGGWMPAMAILEEMLNCKTEGLFERLSTKALQKWRVNKPLKAKTGIELPKGAVPLCEALATLRDVATDAHQGCKKARILAQQNNGLPYICCAIHSGTPEYNFVRLPGWLVAATSTLCLQGYYYPEHKDKWVEVLCDNRRLILLKYVILWNVYLMNDVATKLNRPELRMQAGGWCSCSYSSPGW